MSWHYPGWEEDVYGRRCEECGNSLKRNYPFGICKRCRRLVCDECGEVESTKYRSNFKRKLCIICETNLTVQKKNKSSTGDVDTVRVESVRVKDDPQPSPQ
jgi:hypothetical protein